LSDLRPRSKGSLIQEPMERLLAPANLM